MNKGVHVKAISALSLISLFFAQITFAAPPGSPYNPGETTDPSCAPGSANCDVDVSIFQTLSGSTDTDLSGSATGSTLYYDGSQWVDLDLGTQGQVLMSSGTTLIWTTPASFSDTDDQTLSLSGSQISIVDGNTIDIGSVFTDTNTQLTESQVDTFVNNNGYLTGSSLSGASDTLITGPANGSLLYYDGSNWIDLDFGTDGQMLTNSGGTLVWKTPVAFTDTDDQTLTLSGSNLSIADGNSVDLSSISGSSSLSGATDTDLTGSATGSLLQYDGSEWIDLDIGTQGQILSSSGGTLVWTDATMAANDRIFADDTSVAPALAGLPTITEIQTWATTNTVTDQVIIYNGTDVDSGAVTFAYHSDASGVVTLLRTPDSANEDLAIFFIEDQVQAALVNGVLDWGSSTPSINNVGTWTGTGYIAPNSGFYEITGISSARNQSSQADDTFNYDIRVNGVAVSTQVVDPMAYAGNNEEAQIMINAIVDINAGDVIDTHFSGVGDVQNYVSKSMSIKQMSRGVFIDPDLVPVNNAGVSDGDVLVWNNANNRYEPNASGAGTSTLSGATDTNLTALGTGSTLYFDGSQWIDLDVGTPGQKLVAGTGGILTWETDSTTSVALHYFNARGGMHDFTFSTTATDNKVDFSTFVAGVDGQTTSEYDPSSLRTSGTDITIQQDGLYKIDAVILHPQTNQGGSNNQDAFNTVFGYQINGGTGIIIGQEDDNNEVDGEINAHTLLELSTNDVLTFYIADADDTARASEDYIFNIIVQQLPTTAGVGVGGGGSADLDGLTDTNLTSEGIGSLLYYDGSEWIDLDVGTPGQKLVAGTGGILTWETDSTTSVDLDYVSLSTSTGISNTLGRIGQKYQLNGINVNQVYDPQGLVGTDRITVAKDGIYEIHFSARGGTSYTSNYQADIRIDGSVVTLMEDLHNDASQILSNISASWVGQINAGQIIEFYGNQNAAAASIIVKQLPATAGVGVGGSGGSADLDGLTDTNLTSQGTGSLLQYDGSEWIDLDVGTLGQTLSVGAGGTLEWVSGAPTQDIGHYRFVATANNVVTQPAGSSLFRIETGSDTIDQGGIASYNPANGQLTVTSGANEVIVKAHLFTDGSGAASHNYYFRNILDGTGIKLGGNGVISSEGIFGEASDSTPIEAIIPANTTITIDIRSTSSSGNQATQIGSYIEAKEIAGQKYVIDANDLAVNTTSEGTGSLLYYDGSEWIDLDVGTPGQKLVAGTGGILTWETDSTTSAPLSAIQVSFTQATVDYSGLSHYTFNETIYNIGGDLSLNPSGSITLTAGKRYNLAATLQLGAAAPGLGIFRFMDLTNNVQLGETWDINSSNFNTNFGDSPHVEYIIEPSANIDVGIDWVSTENATRGELAGKSRFTVEELPTTVGVGVGGGSSDLDGLSDTNFTSQGTGSLLYYDGTEWIDLDVGTQGQMLTSSGGTLVWTTSASSDGIDDILSRNQALSADRNIEAGTREMGIDGTNRIFLGDEGTNGNATIFTVDDGSETIELEATNISMQGNRVQSVGTPTAATDAATKGYVDAIVNDQASSGYMDIGDMRMQWGVAGGTGAGRVVTFPATFGSSPVVTLTADQAGVATANLDFSPTTTNFTFTVRDDSAAVLNSTVHWQAIGLRP